MFGVCKVDFFMHFIYEMTEKNTSSHIDAENGRR